MDGQALGFETWTSDTKMKARANAKVTTTLQCGLIQEQLSKINPFQNTKESWKKLIELDK